MNTPEARTQAQQLVADWPPLTDAQRERLAVLLRGSDDSRPSRSATSEAA